LVIDIIIPKTLKKIKPHNMDSIVLNSLYIFVNPGAAMAIKPLSSNYDNPNAKPLYYYGNIKKIY